MKVCNFWIAPLLVLAAPTAQAQSFTKITVKPAASSSVESRRVSVFPSGDVIATSINPASLLDFAYDVSTNPSERLSPLPDWTFTQRYDITARTAGKTQINAADAINGRTVKDEFRLILQERFQLKMRVKAKAIPVYALVVAPDGAKMTHSEAVACVYDTAPSGCHTFVVGFGHPLNGHAVTMDDLAHYIENWTDLPVVNRTGLNGFFTTHSDGWLPMHLPPPPPNGNSHVDFSYLQTIDAVLKELGLSLQKETAALPIYTIERFEQPSLDK